MANDTSRKVRVMADPVAPSKPVDLAHLGRLAADLIARREVGASISAFHQATGAGEDGLVYAVQARQHAEQAWTEANPAQQILDLLEALRTARREIRMRLIVAGQASVEGPDRCEPNAADIETDVLEWALARLDAAVRVEG